jgi:hypothetical protein
VDRGEEYLNPSYELERNRNDSDLLYPYARFRSRIDATTFLSPRHQLARGRVSSGVWLLPGEPSPLVRLAGVAFSARGQRPAAPMARCGAGCHRNRL